MAVSSLSVALSFIILSLCADGASVWGQPLEMGGHVKLHGSVFTDGNGGDYSDQDLYLVDARLKERYSTDATKIDVHEELTIVNPRKLLTPLGSAGHTDKTSLFRLALENSDNEGTTVLARLDRASVSREFSSGTFIFGRQAYSIGNGLVFSTMDVFNPFSPLAIDKEYKNGADMFLIRLHLLPGGDTEFVAVPRRDLQTNEVQEDDSSFVVHQRERIEFLKIDLDLLAAKHRGDLLFGGGGSKDVWGATARADVVSYQSEDERSKTGFLINSDRGFQCFGRNCYALFEFFHSPFGSKKEAYLIPNQERDTRLVQGELYTVGKNYMALGGRVELSSLVNFFATNIVNLQDRSSMFQSRVSWDAFQNVVFQVGGTVPLGGMGDEFGNRGGSQLPEAQTKRAELFVRGELYF